MLRKHWIELREYAEKYDLELLDVRHVRSQRGVEIAMLAIQELDDKLTIACHRLGSTMEMHSGIFVAVRRTENAWKRHS